MDFTQIRSRQAELVSADILTEPITIIGCGAIGSFTALTLAKMGMHNLDIFDGDSVSEENISNQFYRYNDIGNNKAYSLLNMIRDFEQVYINHNEENWTRHKQLERTVIMAVDSMTVRQQIYDKIATSRNVRRFIDGRMGGQQAELYAFDNVPEQRERYAQYLWSEQDASELPCTQKAVMYNVLWIASGIANTLRLMLEGKPYNHLMYMDFENQVQCNINI